MWKVLYLPLLLLCLPDATNAQFSSTNTENMLAALPSSTSKATTTIFSNTVGWSHDSLIATSNVPDCTPPEHIKVIEQGEDYTVVTWEGPPASAGEVAYKVRYRPLGGASPTVEMQITTGKTVRLSEMIAGTEYEVTVQKICFWTDGTELLSEPITLSPVSATGPPQAAGNCGGDFIFPACDGPFAETGSWTTLSVGGFSIQVLTNQIEYIYTGANEERVTKWTGTGRIQLPFGSKYVRVEWTKVDITPTGKICGLVKGISDVQANLPNLNPAPAIFGNEICKKPPSQPGFNANGIHSETGQPWDPYGFGPTGQYVKQPPYPGWTQGMPYDSLYDPNGFDKNGIHFETGTKYGPDGCSAQGLDSLGQKCTPGNGTPYYWLQTDDASPETRKLLESVDDSLAMWIQQNLLIWQASIQDSVTQKSAECAGIRTVMDGLVIALGYQPKRELIFGPGDVYFNPGMWRHFSSEPKQLSVEIDRDPNQKLLESKHIDLYHCDKRLDSYDIFKDLVDSLLTTNGAIGDLAEAMEDLILQLSPDEAKAFDTDHNALRKWLKDNLRTYISATWCGGTCSAPRTRPQKRPAPAAQPKEALWGSTEQKLAQPSDFALEMGPDVPFRSIGSLASAEDLNWLQLLGSGDAKFKSAMNQYLDGEEYINGLHRAFYVAAHGEAKLHPAGSPFFFTKNNPELMPVDISNRASDGRKYSVWLDKIEFTPLSAKFDAYVIVEIPNSGQKIAFSALNTAFTPNGAVAKIQLVNDVKVRMSNTVEMTLIAGPNTFVSFDCDGFAGIGLDVDIEVCRNIVKPLNPANMQVLPDPKRVAAHIQVFVPTLDEFYAEVSIDPFVVTGIEDFKWVIDGVVIDFSDVVSPNHPPPPGYVSPFASGTSFSPLWRGFYMRLLSVTMPNQFNANGTPLTVGVERLVIDQRGVSGRVFASPLLPLDQGNAGGWAFSVAEFSMSIVANQPVNAGFKGLVHVPVFSRALPNNGGCNTGTPTAQDCFVYDAFIEPGLGDGPMVYRMTVATGTQTMCANMWKAGEVYISPGSQINMKIENGKFGIVAQLSGKVKITEPLSGNVDVKIPQITFQNLVIRNEKPYFSPGVWGCEVSTGAGLGGFDLSLTHIKMVESDEEPALSFEADIMITEKSINLSAGGGFLVRGQMTTGANGRQRWVYKDFKITDIRVDGSFQGVEKIAGTLSFFEGHATFGTGWRGGVALTIKGVAEVTAVAQFGRIKTPAEYRYFFVDAMACLDKGFGGALKLKGFGGGVYHHMNRPPSGYSLPVCSGMPSGIPAGLGVSLSGIQYTPDMSKGLGIKATIAIATALKESAFNANATLELLFNADKSLSDLWIYGNARFMDDLQMSASSEKTTQNGSAVSADLDIRMNFNTSTLDGNLQVHMNVNGGVVRGGGPANLLAKAVLHISTDKWFIKIGEPSSRASLVVSIPVIGSIADIGTYLQIGKDLDPMPAMPSEITALTGNTTYTGLSNRNGAMGGNGFIFGADMKIGSQNMNFLIFYAGIRARLGFDVAVLDYGDNAVCAQTGQQVGINGWYASGQLYAGLWGEVGIKVKVFGKRKQFKIFDVGLAASLQASLPNPFWAKGSVGGQYNLLNGLIKGQCNFDITFGEKCQVVGADDPLGDIAVVQRISPETGTTGIGTDAKPEVYFNFPMNEAFQLGDVNGNNISYKATLDQVKVRYYGLDVACSVEWAADRRSLKVSPDWLLPDHDTVELVVRSHVDSSGHTIYEEERIAKLLTGPGLRYIPAANVKGSYPLDGQFNFFPDQIPDDQKGYILLERGQPNLFWGDDKDKLRVRFQKKCGPVKEVALQYDGFQEKIEYDIPNGFFEPGGIYQMQVLKKGSTSGGSSGGGTASRMPGGNCTTPPAAVGQEVLYTAYFRVSTHATFGAKLAAWNAAKVTTVNGNTIIADANMEPFDEGESISGPNSRIEIRASLSGNSWYANQIAPRLYESNDACNMGLPICLPTNGPKPEEAVDFKPRGAAPAIPHITRDHWLDGTVPGTSVQMRLNYQTLSIIQSDWAHIKTKTQAYVAQAVIPDLAEYSPNHICRTNLCASGCSLMGSLPSPLKAMYCNGTFPAPPSGAYKVIVRYKMPGTGAWGSEQVITLNK